MPKQNRPLVRDGRLQAKKKRTDRSYLRPGSAPEPAAVEEPASEEPAAAAVSEAISEPEIARPEPTAALAPPVAEPPAPEAAPARASGKLPTTVRAIQQQGVRKRRDVDLQALATRDTKYALHEMRRIFILAAMVITTLIVLGFVLR